MTQTIFNPEKWLESTVRAIHDYVANSVNLDLFNIVMEFPGPMLDEQNVPLSKTIIHFEIDDMPQQHIGMGDSPAEWNYDAPTQSVNPQWAAVHRINFDVGVWSSDKSGGTTARMRARQMLHNLFGNPGAVVNFRELTSGDDGGVEILQFGGGRNAVDTVNDVRVYRMVDGQLEVRVFSRTPLSDTTAPAIEEISQSPGLTILG